MTMSCDCYYGEYDWWYELPIDPSHWFVPLDTKRARRCCSCRIPIAIGDECTKVARWRYPNSEDEEMKRGNHEIWLAPYYLCETCSGLAMSIQSLGACFTLGNESLKQQIAEYNCEHDVQTMRRHRTGEG